jgi:hypothetical protein
MVRGVQNYDPDGAVHGLGSQADCGRAGMSAQGPGPVSGPPTAMPPQLLPVLFYSSLQRTQIKSPKRIDTIMNTSAPKNNVGIANLSTLEAFLGDFPTIIIRKRRTLPRASSTAAII